MGQSFIFLKSFLDIINCKYSQRCLHKESLAPSNAAFKNRDYFAPARQNVPWFSASLAPPALSWKNASESPAELGLWAKRRVGGTRTESDTCRWSKRTGGSEKKGRAEHRARSISEAFFPTVFLGAKV